MVARDLDGYAAVLTLDNMNSLLHTLSYYYDLALFCNVRVSAKYLILEIGAGGAGWCE